jgi:ribonuclease HI
MLRIHHQKEGNTLYSAYGLAAHDSANNVAEYAAIIQALQWLIALPMKIL